MKFEELSLKEICGVIEFSPQSKEWYSFNSNHIIGVQIEGMSSHDYGEKKLTIEKNCIYFLNQSEPYHVKILEQGLAYSVHFTTWEPISTPSFCIKLSNINDVVRIENRIQSLFFSGRKSNELSMQFYRLCALFDSYRDKGYAQKNKNVIRSKEYMDLHFREADCLEKAAELSSLSRRRFNDLFKSIYDLTPNRFIISKRIEYAKFLLSTGGISITETAELCGFADLYYFSKVFKDETGFSPSALKKITKG